MTSHSQHRRQEEEKKSMQDKQTNTRKAYGPPLFSSSAKQDWNQNTNGPVSLT